MPKAHEKLVRWLCRIIRIIRISSESTLIELQRRRHCVLRNALSNSFVARKEYARWKSNEIVMFFLTLFFQGGDPELGEEVVTIGGPDVGAFCVFPFIWKSKVHRSCAKVRTVSFLSLHLTVSLSLSCDKLRTIPSFLEWFCLPGRYNGEGVEWF